MPELKQLATEIFHRTLGAIDIPATMRQKLAPEGSRISIDGEVVDLAAFRRVVAVAVGKASVAFARGLVEVLGPERPVAGILVAPHELLQQDGAPITGFRAIGAGHPLPDEGSLAGARAILDLLHTCDEHTLVFFLLSGGGSALVELPRDASMTLADLRALYGTLVGCGASIDEINAVRKHLSAIKGGRLAAAAPVSKKLTFGITDVPVGCESALASGLTIPDPTTVADVHRVIDRYGLAAKIPPSVATQLPHLSETPKASDPIFARSRFEILLGMHDLFHHAHQAAEALGVVAECDNATDDWPLAKAADYLLGELAKLQAAYPGRRVALIADGEVSSPVTGAGVGGRNCAFVLDCVEKITGKQIAVLSAGTDGKDGSSPAAGAVVDGETLARARAQGLSPADYFRRSDSYSFFHLLGDAIETGPTGNNLRDLRVLIGEPLAK